MDFTARTIEDRMGGRADAAPPAQPTRLRTEGLRPVVARVRPRREARLWLSRGPHARGAERCRNTTYGGMHRLAAAHRP